MSEETGDDVKGEGELAPPDWRVRAGCRISPTQKRDGRTRSNARPVQKRVTHCMMGRGRRHQAKERGTPHSLCLRLQSHAMHRF